MNRRELLAGAAAAAAPTRFATAAQPDVPIIGYRSTRTPAAETPIRNAFLEALERAGFVAGRNVTIEYRFAEGVERVPFFAAELVGLPAALLVATESRSAVAAKKATATIPIVFGLAGPDPVQLGLVASLGRPSGN